MDVILLERVEKLGAIGDVVKVKDGFARNFLLPNKKALRANEANRKVFEANRARIESDNAKRRGEAEKDAAGFKDIAAVTLIRQASNTGQLYGSVAVRDLVEALEAAGHKVDPQPGGARQADQGDRALHGQGRAAPRGVGSRSRSTSPARPRRPKCRRRASTSWRRCSSATRPVSSRITIPMPSRVRPPRFPTDEQPAAA